MLDTAIRDDSTDGGVNTPKINPKTMEVGRRAVKDGKQAAELGDALEKGAERRNDVNSVVVAKYDGEQPFSAAAIQADGGEWRSNFPTGFMSGIIDRIVPVPMATIDNSRYLTNAKLDPDKFKEDTEAKSEFFCGEITRTVRRWRGWRPFCYSLFQEVILIGYAIAASLDKYEWRPRLCRSDEGFLPDGTGQHADSAQAFAANHDAMIHELVEVIADTENAKAAGWKIEPCVKSLDRAMPKGESDKPRVLEDMIREGTRGASYSSAAKVVRMRVIVVVEPTTEKSEDGKYHQKVSKYIVDRDAKDVLLEAEDEFESMSDCIALFTLQTGNAKFYGSRGCGKMLVNLHIAIDRERNMACDQLNFASIKLLKCDAKSAPTLQMRMRHPFAIVSTDAEFAEEDIAPNIAEFVQLDQMLVSIAEQAANAYIPNKLSEDASGSRTATEAAIDNSRDQQAKVAYLARLWGQFGDMMTTIQKKLCDPETIDEEAKELQERLKKRLSPAEIEALANCPAAEVVQDIAAAENRQILIAAGELDGNPFINQEKLLRRKVTAMTNPQIADDLILPGAVDPTVESENIRQQLMENEMFMLGASMPVSPRDNHSIHFKLLRGELERTAPAIAQNAMQNPAILDHINAALMHGQAHIDMAVGENPPSDEWKDNQKFIKEADGALQKLAGEIAKQQKAQQAAMAAEQERLAMSAAAEEQTALNGGNPTAPVTSGGPAVAAEPVAPSLPPVIPPPGTEVVMPPIPASADVAPVL